MFKVGNAENSGKYSILFEVKHLCSVQISSTAKYFFISQYFPGIPSISREFPVFPAVPGNTLISREIDNPGMPLLLDPPREKKYNFYVTFHYFMGNKGLHHQKFI